jgi:hypothetical protein
MKSKRSLMTVLIGLAMLATPITAAAKNHDGGNRNDGHQWQSRSYNAPARNFAENRHEFRSEGRGHWAAPVQVAHRDWDEGDHGWNEDRGEHRGWNRGWGNADDYRHYGYRDEGYRGYYAPTYVAPAPYYGYSGYGGRRGPCARAQGIANVYRRDQYTGHPAAARDLLPQLRNAERACGGVPYSGGLFGGGYGSAPVFANYDGYNGNNGYNGYNYGGYNGYQSGYGASMLGPLLQQFIH